MGEKTTFPTMIDDAEMTSELKERVINIFTACGESDSTAQRAYKIRSGLVIAANFTMKDIDRLE